MSEFLIPVEGGKSVRLPTGGKYCPEDIVITAAGETSGMRQLREGALTEEEKKVLGGYRPSGYFTVSHFTQAVYGLAGIDLAPVFGNLGFFDILKKLFDVDTGELLPEGERDEAFQRMLLPQFYGGGRRANLTQIWEQPTLVPEQLQVGDLFLAAEERPCSVGGARWVYFFGIYQGDGSFLMVENHTAAVCTDCNRMRIDVRSVTSNTAAWRDGYGMNNFRYYFVLRPDKLAAEQIEEE